MRITEHIRLIFMNRVLPLLQRNCDVTVSWVAQHAHWNQEWYKTSFSDENEFNLKILAGYKSVWQDPKRGRAFFLADAIFLVNLSCGPPFLQKGKRKLFSLHAHSTQSREEVDWKIRFYSFRIVSTEEILFWCNIILSYIVVSIGENDSSFQNRCFTVFSLLFRNELYWNCVESPFSCYIPKQKSDW